MIAGGVGGAPPHHGGCDDVATSADTNLVSIGIAVDRVGIQIKTGANGDQIVVFAAADQRVNDVERRWSIVNFEIANRYRVCTCIAI